MKLARAYTQQRMYISKAGYMIPLQILPIRQRPLRAPPSGAPVSLLYS